MDLIQSEGEVLTKFLAQLFRVVSSRGKAGTAIETRLTRNDALLPYLGQIGHLSIGFVIGMPN
jgi:hypothetical protein